LLLFIVFTNCSSPTSKEGDSTYLLIRNATIIDGKGNEAVRNVDILIENNRIKKIGNAIDKPSITKEIDASGLTVLPGLIDSHVHISSVPGSGYRNDSLELTQSLQRQHLKAYLACGVTTILDPGIPVEEAKKIISWLDEGHPGPRLLVLSPAFTTKDGYVSDPSLGHGLFFPGVSSDQDVKDRLFESRTLNPIGVKVFLESGFGFGRLPIHSPEIRQAIIEQAGQRNLPLYIHSTSNEDHHLALDMEPLALLHGATVGSDEIITRLKEKPAYMITTLSIQDAWTIAFNKERLDDPFYRSTVPMIELQTAANQEAWENLNIRFAKMALTESAKEDEIVNFLQGENPAEVLVAWLNNVKKLHEADIPIVMGSDAGNWPVMPQMFHGPTSVREVELLKLAGLTPLEAIKASTSVPADMLELAENIGTIEEGKIADLIIVSGDPQNDITALQSLKWTIKDGVAKTPEQWMNEMPADKR